MKTYEVVLEEGKKTLEECGIIDANLDAWYLLEAACGMDRVEYILRKSQEIDEEEYLIYEQLMKKRMNNVPLGYILGKQAFMGLEFFINENVLIPRFDTELLTEMVLKKADNKTILDMCTGSGCIIISLVKLAVRCKGIGVDISEKALQVAKDNALLHRVHNISFVQSDLFENVTGRFDIIVSNPPYIPTDEIDKLMPEVSKYEPRSALDGSVDGLEFYRRIIKKASDFLNDNGSIYLEIGYNQGNDVKSLLEQAGFINIQVVKDYAEFDRVVFAKKN